VTLTYSEVYVVQHSGHHGQQEVGVWFIQIFEPQHARTRKVLVFCRYFSDWKNHNNEHWDLDQVVEVERKQAGIGLPWVVNHRPAQQEDSFVQG